MSYTNNYSCSLEKYVVVDTFKSFIKSEWTSIRTNNEFVDYDVPVARFPEECCGILFAENYAYASNGHWLVKAKVDGPSFDVNVSHFFYDYNSEEIYENYNPFVTYADLSIEDMLKVMQLWRTFCLKLRVTDIIDLSDQFIPAIRHRRATAIEAKYIPELNKLQVELKYKKKTVSGVFLDLHSSAVSEFPTFSVNLSYLYKVMQIIRPYYHVVDLCINDEVSPLVIKAKNPFLNKPDLRFALGQYNLS